MTGRVHLRKTRGVSVQPLIVVPPPGDAELPVNDLLQALPVAVYTTDADGRITSYNDAAAALWGCRPTIGQSQWCGSWRLFHLDGRPMPHDQCPMAMALREQREIRWEQAVAERPDGSRVPFLAFPTPLRDQSGVMMGGLNTLIDLSGHDPRRRSRHAPCSDRGILDRRHHQQGLERHHQKLEQSCSIPIRLHPRRDNRPPGDDAHSCRPPG